MGKAGLEGGLEVAQLGSHVGVGRQQRPTRIVYRPGRHLGRQRFWKATTYGRESTHRLIYPAPEQTQSGTLIHRVSDGQCIGNAGAYLDRHQ